MATHSGSLNLSLGDGSVRTALRGHTTTLQALAQSLRGGGQVATAIALGPMGPALLATVAGLRNCGVALAQPVPLPNQGEWPLLLVVPGGVAGGQVATGLGFVGLPAGPVPPAGLLLPAVQRLRESAARAGVSIGLGLVLVQPTAETGGAAAGTDQLKLNYNKID